MKTILLSILAVSTFSVASLAADSAGPDFLTTGRTYDLTYTDTNQSVTAKNLPRWVTLQRKMEISPERGK